MMKFYHLSSQDLGKTFEFIPRIPREPYLDDDQNPIEDVVTKRTCWARDLNKCWEALDKNPGVYYIYGVNELPGHIDVEQELKGCQEELGLYGQKYDIRWNMNDYIEYVWNTYKIELTPKQVKLGDLCKCVPDANRTGEQWATLPVVGTRLGTFNSGHVRWENEIDDYERKIAQAKSRQNIAKYKKNKS